MIPLQNTDLESIYAHSLGAGVKSLAITSANPGEGVSSVAVALTQRHLLAGKSTLFIDLNCDKSDHESMLPCIDNDGDSVHVEPRLITDQEQNYALLGLPAPQATRGNLKWRDPGVIERYLDGWLQNFDAVVIDAGALRKQSASLIPAERIVACCTSTLLVVLAGVTTVPMVRNSCQRITQAGGQLSGCVLNNLHNPALRQELLRESDRLTGRLAPISLKFRQWINNSRLLSLEL